MPLVESDSVISSLRQLRRDNFRIGKYGDGYDVGISNAIEVIEHKLKQEVSTDVDLLTALKGLINCIDETRGKNATDALQFAKDVASRYSK